MKSRIKRALVACAAGMALTAGLAGAAYLSRTSGAYAAARILFWQNTLLQSLVGFHNIGTLEHPVYEGTPVNFLAFLASFPVGVVVYSLLAYFALSLRSER